MHDTLPGRFARVRTASADSDGAADLIGALGDERFTHVFVFLPGERGLAEFMRAARRAVSGQSSGWTASGGKRPAECEPHKILCSRWKR